MMEHYPNLPYSAGLIGYGSDVLGCDNETSMDHNWGPRCLIFLNDEDDNKIEELSDFFSKKLPFSFMGFPVNYSDPHVDGTQKMQETNSYPIRHLIEVYNLNGYLSYHLRINDIKKITTSEWLGLYDQLLIELISGEVFHDGLNRLNSFRDSISFYPNDILKLRLAALWNTIGTEESFIGRSIELGDFISLKTIATRITNTLLKICFYINRKYVPYSKWFGTALQNLDSTELLSALAEDILKENNPKQIELKLCSLYEYVVKLHNQENTLPKIDNKVQNFYNRPFKVIFGENITEIIMASINDDIVRKLQLNNAALDLKIDGVDFTDTE